MLLRLIVQNCYWVCQHK